ncbi:MAG: thermonuclease family protein [Methyloceanibacter sp.]
MPRRIERSLVFAAASLAACLALQAQACDLPPPETGTVETGTVAAVIDGETLKLADGRTVKLIGAKAPLAPLGWRGDDPWPFVEEARGALEALAAGKTIELRFGGSRTDRHGYLLAQAHVVTGETRLWLQEELVGRGLARVYSLPDNRACVGELLAREAEARGKGLGLWASSAYRIEDANDAERLGRLIHSYQLIEGTVRNVGEGGSRLYLNFADDWRSDFTISIARKDTAAFAAAGLDPRTLLGKRLRVRGWLAWRNGPMIEATHPDQIELLPERRGAAGGKPEPERRAIAL